jgi:predicted dithiol-disulfide oxidoreductase (DUF899 family)
MRNQVVSREEWLRTRLELLAAEKEFTRQRDALTRRRMAMPWERVEKPYQFEGPNGALSLADLFDGRSQLIVYHFMFGPDWEEACKSCSFWADNFNGIPIHLNHRDVTFAAVSRAPLAKIDAYKKRMGWSFPWVSSHGSDFNFDYHVSFTPEQVVEGKATTTMEFDRLRCRTSRESASSTRMSETMCSTPIPATGAASTCSMAPTITSTWHPKAAMRTTSNSRWSGYVGTISIEALTRPTRRIAQPARDDESRSGYLRVKPSAECAARGHFLTSGHPPSLIGRKPCSPGTVSTSL